MRSHRISGMPRQCLNRNCGELFTKASHLGYKMQSELEVFAVMRCPACRDTFLVTQPIAMAHDYYDKLPKDQEEARKEGSPITIEEMRSFRNQLSNPKSLKTVIESEQNSDDNRS